MNNLLTPFPCAANSSSFGQNNPWLYAIICYKRHLKLIASRATDHINYTPSKFMKVHVHKHARSSSILKANSFQSS